MATALALPPADFIICGGGTAGLVLASRLSEIPTVTVAVLEAGGDHSHDVNVLAPGLLTSLYGDPAYDWIYSSAPQAHMNGTVVSYPRGKQLGGSSAINYLAWTHASPRNIDNWGALGNEGWSWAALEPYFAKSENFSMPSAEVVERLDLHWLNGSVHGTAGPIRNGYPRAHAWSPIDEAWPRTFEKLGVGMVSDERDGLALGGYDIQTNLNVENNTRSYAATSYLNPIRYRKNMSVYTHALVTKVDVEETGKEPSACGVRFRQKGKEFMIRAGKEVMLSAGAFGSPQLLELSGIGDEKLLKSLDIETVHQNSHVGENLQDHLLLNLGWPVVPGVMTTDNLATPAAFDRALAEYKSNHTGPLAMVALGGGYLSAGQILETKTKLRTFLKRIRRLVHNDRYSRPEYQRQSRLILKDIYEGQEISQFLNIVGSVNPLNASAAPPKHSHGFTIQVCAEHMFSRGSVHIRSNNASVYPIINPNFFSHPADAYMMAKMALYAQNVVARTPPLSDYLVSNGTVLQPLYTNLTETNAEHVVRREAQSVSHPCGTCAMLPRGQGGVIDERFRVYGVGNLRVVDASVFPLVPRGNLQTAVYAVAERAADMIKQDYALAT